MHMEKDFAKILKSKNLREYYDLYVQSITLLLVDVFENFRNMRLETQELDPVHFLTALGLAWQAALKKAKVKLDFLTDIIRGGICHSIYRYANANNRYMKGCD